VGVGECRQKLVLQAQILATRVVPLVQPVSEYESNGPILWVCLDAPIEALFFHWHCTKRANLVSEFAAGSWVQYY
jgi:hypothetical protein